MGRGAMFRSFSFPSVEEAPRGEAGERWKGKRLGGRERYGERGGM